MKNQVPEEETPGFISRGEKERERDTHKVTESCVREIFELADRERERNGEEENDVASLTSCLWLLL